MKVYALVGKSGTGKSYQAQNLCRQLKIKGIIDDGLFIYENKVISGVSAKRQDTKIGAVKTALFHKDDHQIEVAESIKKINPDKILVIGTSDGMVSRIAARLDLPEISETIYITDITTEEEREIAYRQRHDLGKHVIPAPAFQLKRQFSGYFMSPLLLWRDWSAAKGGVAEKSVVRPTYSYLGDYKLSDKVFADIVNCVGREVDGVAEISRVIAVTVSEGVELMAVVYMQYGHNIMSAATELQNRAAKMIEEMTAFNVNKFNIEIRGLK
jgi:uncharacterized alkaline shock family protein YloU